MICNYYSEFVLMQDTVAYTSAFDDQLELPAPQTDLVLPRQHSTSSFCSEFSDGFEISLEELEVAAATEGCEVAMATDCDVTRDAEDCDRKMEEGKDDNTASLPVARTKPISDAYFFYQGM